MCQAPTRPHIHDKHALFPLTPALSLRERENQSLRSNKSKRLGFSYAVPSMLPLPEGEYLFGVFDGTLSGFRFNGPPTQGSSCLRWELRRGRRSSQPWAGGRNPFGIGEAPNTGEDWSEGERALESEDR